MTLSVGSTPRAAAPTAVPGRGGFTSRLRRQAAAAWQELARGRAIDAAVSAELALERGERVLAVDKGLDGECALVATDRALYHRFDRGGSPAGAWSRLGWEEIARVGWDADAGRLIITGAVPAGAVPPRTVVPLRQRGTVPELVMERVTHTRLGQWQLLAGGTRRAVIEARRRPGTGELLWSVTCAGDGHGHADPDIRARAERAIARLSAELGALPQSGTGLSAVHAAIGRPRSGDTAAAAG